MLESLLQIDHGVFDFINQNMSNSLFDAIMPVIRNKKTWIPFYIIGAVLLFKFQGKKSIWIILLAILSIGIADGISSHLLKDYFARIRPCLLPEFSEHVNLILSRCSGAYSFPSSHAANHFALAFFLALVFIKEKYIGLVLLFWAGLISYAQIYVGVHFPTDVIGGMLVGLFSGAICFLLYRSFLRRSGDSV